MIPQEIKYIVFFSFLILHTFEISSAMMLPEIGVGVYKLDPDACYFAVKEALRLGIRHIDTARYYYNEEAVGAAIRDSEVPRETIFITSKIWLKKRDRQKDKTTSPHDQVIREGTMSRHKLDTYIDLYLLHAPMKPISDYWKGMETLVDMGITKKIGVSNFGVHHLDCLFASAKIPPAVNQLELNPFRQQKALCEYCMTKNIQLVAHSPLCHGEKFGHPIIGGIAQQLDVTEAEVMLAYGLQKGWKIIPKASSSERMKRLQILPKLTLSVMDALDTLEENYVVGWDPVTWKGAGEIKV